MRKKIILAISLAASLPGAIGTTWGQQCSDWSPYFNQIDDSSVLQELQSQRSQGWPSFNPANNGGNSLQQSIAQGDQLIQQLQQAIQEDRQAWTQVRSTNITMPNVSATQCSSGSGGAGAAMAVACDAHSKHNELLSVEGMNDLMRCRAGLPAGSYASPGSFGMANSADQRDAFQRGAESAAAANISKRAGMVNSVAKTWKPPVVQEEAQGSLAQSTALADPFAPPHAHVTPTDNPSPWSDPLDEAGSDNNLTSSLLAAPEPDLQAEISASLDAGTANSNEVSATPVAEVADASNWDRFVNANSAPTSSSDLAAQASQGNTESSLSDASFSIDSSSSAVIATAPASSPDHGSTIIGLETSALGELNDDLNGNEASKYVVDQGLKQAGGQFQQAFKVIDDANATGIFNTDASAGDNSMAVQQFNTSSNNMADASVKGVVPGYKYADTVTSDITSWQQSIQKTIGTIKINAQSFYNRVTGAPDCTDPYTSAFDRDCHK